MKAVIVGGSGFIGTRLVSRLLERGHEVRIVDKAPSKAHPKLVTIADVRDLPRLTEAMRGNDAIVNLAAEHRDDVQPISLYDEVNVGGARNVCAAADELGIKRIVFTSSVAVYGFAPPDTDETGALNPFNDYGRTKMEAEKVYREWLGRGDDRSLVIVRPTVVFGERNRGNVYNLLRQIHSRKFVMVGRGTNVKSMAYVENVAAFLEHALGFGPGEHLFNYVDKPDLDMNTLVRTVRKALGRPAWVGPRLPYFAGRMVGRALDEVAKVTGRTFPLSAIRVKKFCATTRFASERKLETGFQPPVSLADGLERTIRFEFLSGRSGDDAYVFVTE